MFFIREKRKKTKTFTQNVRHRILYISGTQTFLYFHLYFNTAFDTTFIALTGLYMQYIGKKKDVGEEMRVVGRRRNVEKDRSYGEKAENFGVRYKFYILEIKRLV